MACKKTRKRADAERAVKEWLRKILSAPVYVYTEEIEKAEKAHVQKWTEHLKKHPGFD